MATYACLRVCEMHVRCASTWHMVTRDAVQTEQIGVDVTIVLDVRTRKTLVPLVRGAGGWCRWGVVGCDWRVWWQRPCARV